MPRAPLPLVCALIAGPLFAADKPTPPGPNGPNGPLAPAAATTALRLADGFALSLVAHEPAVIDPVCLCFDAKGRLYVCEMPGYPNKGLATDGPEGGRIKRFEDKDGDGTFETTTLFAKGLRYPTGLMSYKTGLIVADAPEIAFLDDPDNDGVSNSRTAWYAGFDLANIQALPNALQWGPDNLVYGMVPGGTGVVTSPQVPDMKPVPLRARGFRFDPAKPGSFEPTSGGGQYGLTRDAFGHWFTSTNSQQLRQVVLPDAYVRRNPDLAVPATTLDIPDHGPSAKVFRLSPPEAWRQERTDRRLQGVGLKWAGIPQTELVSAGYTSSTCSPVVYDADLFPPAYRGTVFVCDPGNNLMHRTRLEPDGAVFVARRADPDRQFLAATDNWFRPVFLTLGPDGALYLCDFYREIIETPLSIPEDIKARLILESRNRGRVWRIAPTDSKPAKLPDLAGKTDAELAQELLSPNQWVRTTARRLLVERGARVRGGAALAAKAKGTTGLLDVLSAMAKLGGLTNEVVASTLADPLPGNREVALRFAEPRLFDPTVRAAAVKLADDPSPMVRFQLALSAGEIPEADRPAVLAKLADSDGESPWTRAAILSSAEGMEAGLAARPATTPGGRAVARQAAGVVGARGEPAEVARVLAAAAGDPDLLDALARGMKPGAFAKLLADPPASARPAVEKLRAAFDDAAKVVGDDEAPPAARVAAARALGYAAAAVPALTAALGKSAPGDVQTAVIRALAGHPAAANTIAAAWPRLSPQARTAAADVLASTTVGANALLDAVAAGKVRPAEVGAARAAALRNHRDANVKKRAGELLAAGSKSRAGVVADYKAALDLKGDPAAGAVVFKAQCAACHKLGDQGHEVGPNLLAVVPGKTGDDLLASILDPNKEVDGRYLGYVATLADGRTLTGVIAAETAAGVTLRRADGAEDALRRADLEALTSTGLSLMPEGLEQQVTKQQFADLLAHLRAATRPK